MKIIFSKLIYNLKSFNKCTAKRSIPSRHEILKINRVCLFTMTKESTKFDKHSCEGLLWILPISLRRHTYTHTHCSIAKCISSSQQVARGDTKFNRNHFHSVMIIKENKYTFPYNYHKGNSNFDNILFPYKYK